MAVIGQIRKRSGLLVVIIGVALAAFVLGDFLKPSSGNRSNDVGVVAGENIPYTEFSARSEEQLEMMRQNQEKERLSPEEIFQTRLRTWNQMVSDIVMGKEYEALGLGLSAEELFDQVQGPEPHAYILQYFRDPETNMYNSQLVLNYLRNLDNMEPEAKDQWLILEKAIKQDRLTMKYRNLLSKAYFVPTAFAKLDYEWKNTTATARVAALRYNSIPDDQVTLSDADFSTYYEKNKYNYKQEESRDIDYVVFEVKPSTEDIQKAEEEIRQIYSEIATVEDIDAYVNANSDERYDSTYKMQGTLSQRIDSVMFNAEIGTIVGPYFEDNKYKVARLIDKQMRPDSMRASHILIPFRGAFNAAENVSRTKEQAKALADSLKAVVETNPLMFEAVARQYSGDGSVKDNGGDLDWFADQAMVGPFNKAVLEGNTGEITEAETPFGYHVIMISGKKPAVEKVRVAIVSRALEPSSETFQDIYTEASIFAGENTTTAVFDASVAEQGLNKRSATNVKKMDNRIPGIESPRAIVQWAFQEQTEKGSVSPIFDVDGSYVVATLKEVREEGITPLEQIRARIEPLVIREKKAQMIIEKFQAAPSDIYQLASALETKVDTLNNISFFSGNLPGYGPEPEVCGKLFTSTQGQLSTPIQGNTAVFVYIVDAINAPAEKDNFTAEADQMQRNFENKVNQQYFNVLQELYEVEDNRYLYF